MNTVRVVVYGPPGCGKTQHAEELSLMFGCRKVEEQWDGRMHLMDHTLHLTNSLPPYGPVAEDATAIVPWAVAMDALALYMLRSEVG